MLNSGPLTADVKMAMKQKMKAVWSHYVVMELRGLKGDMSQSHYDIICLVNTCKIYAHFDYCKFFKIVPPGLYNMLPRLLVFTAVFRNPKGKYIVILYVCVHVCVCMCVYRLPQTECDNVTSVVLIICFIKQARLSLKQNKIKQNKPSSY